MIPLSILDLSVVTTGTKPAAALRNSIDLARHADLLGYVRYWLAELTTSPRWRARRPI
jgi:alkanesulfonate monooxygenase SsuD/methylene tetrahydromethanopterin reductase-like flavin-dependent oxidoreductase (luciferase family)